MSIKSIGFIPVMVSAHPTELALAMDRLQNEHDLFRDRLKVLEVQAKQVNMLDDIDKGIQVLTYLRQQTIQLVDELDVHADWEQKQLFPFLDHYFHHQHLPSILPSFWVLEKDHELAQSFIQSFMEAVDRLQVKPIKEGIIEAAANLIQACLILNDHITMEEHLVFPLTEQVLTDLDHFFS
ncbi:hypothetical protein D3C73_481130 [compost metagenome]